MVVDVGQTGGGVGKLLGTLIDVGLGHPVGALKLTNSRGLPRIERSHHLALIGLVWRAGGVGDLAPSLL